MACTPEGCRDTEFSQLQVWYCFLPFLRFWALYDLCSADSFAGCDPPGAAAWLGRSWAAPGQALCWQAGLNQAALARQHTQ